MGFLTGLSRAPWLALRIGVALLGAGAMASQTAQADAPAPIRFLLPNPPLGLPGSRDLDTVWAAIVSEYNARPRLPGEPSVQLVRRGDHFSSLKDLMALHLAGDAPEIATVDASELSAIDRTGLPKPIPAPFASSLGLRPAARTKKAGQGSSPRLSLPFQRTLPIVVADQEILFRAHADQGPLPSTWDGLTALAARLASAAPGRAPLALPLQGPRGLWIFESLAGMPLWTREAGGLKANRALEGSILAIQRLLAAPLASAAGATGGAPGFSPFDLSWERALQEFLERKSPLLVTSIDALPLIAKRASFRWKAGPLPSILPGRGPLATGSELVIIQDRPDVWRFLRYLYSKPVAARWVAAGGYLPFRSDWREDPEWKKAPAPYRELARRFAQLEPSRTTDRDIVRAQTEWVTALNYLFGHPSRRLPVETVFTQLDSTLTPH